MKRVIVGEGLVASMAMAIVVLAGSSGAAGAPAASGDPVKGQQVYTAQKCSVCHKVGETGGKLGADLTVIGAKRDAAWLAKYLLNPTVLDPKNKIKMPPSKVKGQDLDDLVAYLLTLKGKK